MRWTNIWQAFATGSRVTLNADGSATVNDNGRGIPVGMHEKGGACRETGVHDASTREESSTILSIRPAAGFTVWGLPW